MIINLLNEYFVNRPSDNNRANLINWYLEIENANTQISYQTGGLQPQHGKYKILALPTPGLSSFNADSGTLVRGGINNREIPYFVVDNKLYSYASDGTRTELGTLSTSTGYVELASIGTQIGIVDGTNLYIWNINSSTFTQVSDVDLPANPTTITAQDGFFLVTGVNSISVYASAVGDGTNWDALSFANKNGSDDYVARLISSNRFVWVIGKRATEVWYNAGAAVFAFDAYPNALFEYGTPAPGSVAKGNNSIYFISQSKSGGYTIVESQGLQLQPVSNDAIGYQLSQLTTISDCIAYCYQLDAHEFYVMTFPTDGKTFVFDIKSRLWHERRSLISSVQTRHRGQCKVLAYNKVLIGDSQSGNILYYDMTASTDNGSAITRTLITPPAYNEGKKFFIDKLQIDTETGIGSNPTITVDLSYDSGHTFTNTLTGTVPNAGGRQFWTRLGYTQNGIVMQATTTGNFSILGATADVRTGTN